MIFVTMTPTVRLRYALWSCHTWRSLWLWVFCETSGSTLATYEIQHGINWTGLTFSPSLCSFFNSPFKFLYIYNLWSPTSPSQYSLSELWIAKPERKKKWAIAWGTNHRSTTTAGRIFRLRRKVVLLQQYQAIRQQ